MAKYILAILLANRMSVLFFALRAQGPDMKEGQYKPGQNKELPKISQKSPKLSHILI